MPELPEVESVRRTLEPCVVGRDVRRVRLLRRDVVDGASTGHALLAGARIASLRRHGKQIAVDASDGRRLRVHLGMSGQLLFLRARARPVRTDHVHAIWSLATPEGEAAGRILFRDPRRFGGLATHADEASLRGAWRGLGADALTITPEALRAGLRGTRRAIKDALLDQSCLAGLGNIYTDESLFRAGVRPDRAADTLDGVSLVRLASSIREVLREAVAAGGSTLGDGGYVQGTGAPGAFQRSLRVYGRGGEACLVCGGSLLASVHSQRTTVHCPACQG